MSGAILLRNLLVELGAPPVPCLLSIPEVTKALDADGKPQNDQLDEQMKKFLEQVEWFAFALRNHRKMVGQPQWGPVVSVPR